MVMLRFGFYGVVLASLFSGAVSAADVSLQDGSWSDVEKAIAASKGKVVVVDFWSTSCTPCMEEFPHLVELSRKSPEVVTISVSLDYAGIRNKPPEFYRERVQKFLTEQRADQVKNFLCTEAAEDVLDNLKLDSIPTVVVYGKDGKIARRFDDPFAAKAGDRGMSYQKHVLPYLRDLQPKK